jgi:hypothetical protein
MTRAPDDRFNDWKEKAEAVGLLPTAKMFNAKLRKAGGSEWVGPCCYCGGTDRLGINTGKAKWNCRGFGGGSSAISLAMHLGNMAYKEAIELLTGEPPPNGQSKGLSDQEKAARATTLADAKARERAAQAQQDAYQEDTKAAAQRIWNASQPVAGTVAEQYLDSRGIRTSDVMRGIGVLWARKRKSRGAIPRSIRGLAARRSRRLRQLLCRDADGQALPQGRMGSRTASASAPARQIGSCPCAGTRR